MPNYDFIALDVETANEEFWSICQVGLVFFKKGEIVDTYTTLVNPETEFFDLNIELHGITEEKVKDAPKLLEMFTTIQEKVTDEIVIHHMPFARIAFLKCSDHVQKPQLNCTWLDSARAARHIIPAVRLRGYGLINVANILGIEKIINHDALSHAIVIGKVFQKIVENSKKSISEWIENVNSNFTRWGSPNAEFRDLTHAIPNSDGILFGEVIVFTGALQIPRLEAAKIAFELGCDVDDGVTQNTTLLVVGDQDTRRLAGYSKSAKQRKAEELIRKGQWIRIICENDFLATVKSKC